MHIALLSAATTQTGRRRSLGDEIMANGGFELRGSNGGAITNMHASSIWRASNVAHFTAPGHGLVTGNVVNISGFVETTLNVSNVTVTRVNDDEFTYPNTGVDINPDDTNGYFTTDPFQWWTKSPEDGMLAQSAASNEFYAGEKAAKLIGGATSPSDCRLTQDNDVTPGTEYELSFWTRGDGTHDGAYELYDRSNGEDIIARMNTNSVSSTWSRVSASFIAPDGCSSVRLLLYAPAGGAAFFDEVSFRPVIYS